jgi:hypothetical protein
VEIIAGIPPTQNIKREEGKSVKIKFKNRNHSFRRVSTSGMSPNWYWCDDRLRRIGLPMRSAMHKPHFGSNMRLSLDPAQRLEQSRHFSPTTTAQNYLCIIIEYNLKVTGARPRNRIAKKNRDIPFS